MYCTSRFRPHILFPFRASSISQYSSEQGQPKHFQKNFLREESINNFFLFEFWRAEKIILILSLRTFFRTISGQLIFSECLSSVLIVWNLEKIWAMKRIWLPALSTQNKKQDPPPLKHQTIQTLKKHSENIISKHLCRNLCTKEQKNRIYIAFLVLRKQNKNWIVITKMYKLCTLKCVLHKSFPATYTISFQGFLNFSIFFWTGSAKTFSKKFSTWRIYK